MKGNPMEDLKERIALTAFAVGFITVSPFIMAADKINSTVKGYGDRKFNEFFNGKTPKKKN